MEMAMKLKSVEIHCSGDLKVSAEKGRQMV